MFWDKCATHEVKTMVSSCGSMKKMRELGKQHPELKKEWAESLDQDKMMLEQCFGCMMLTGKYFQAELDELDDDMAALQECLQGHYPDFAPNNTTQDSL